MVSYLDIKLLSISLSYYSLSLSLYTTTNYYLTGNSGQKYTISAEKKKKKGEKMRDLHNVYVCILVFT